MQTNIARRTRGFFFRLFRANEADMELETRATGDGAEKTTPHFFCAFPRRACLTLLGGFALDFTRHKKANKNVCSAG